MFFPAGPDVPEWAGARNHDSALEASEPLRYGEVGHARSEYLLLTLARRFSG
jgi:hypothetical protein